MREKVQFVLDASVFDDAGVPRVDLTGVKNVQIVNIKESPTIRTQADLLPTANPPPSLIAKIKGCCLYGRPPHWSTKFSAELSQKRFDPKKVKVASLFIESATEKEINSSALLKNARVKGDSSSLKGEVDIKKIFQEAKGNTLILLGHVEGTDYVVRTNGNVEQLRVPILKIRAMAKENDVSLIDIGCETTTAIKEKSFGFGVMTRYNSIEAVRSLDRALKTSTTLEDFLVNVSSEGLKVVLEPSFLKEQANTASVYSKIRNASKAVWVKVAQVTFSYFK
jgi:hypothetical protein